MLDPCYDCYEPAIELAGRAAPCTCRWTLPTFAPDWQRVARRDHAAHAHDHDQLAPQSVRRGARRASDLDALADVCCATPTSWCCRTRSTSTSSSTAARTRACCAIPELAERSFVVSSFGKTYHCTGWKVGYCIAPPALSAEFRKVHQYLTFCTFTPAQCAFADVLESDPQHYLELPAFYAAHARPLPRAAATARASSCCRWRRLFPAGRLLRHRRPSTTSRSANGW